MKKKIVFVLALVALTIAFLPATAFAGTPHPPDYGTVDPVGIWPPPPFPQLPDLTGVEKVIPSPKAPGGQIHIITDPLLDFNSGDPAGWVTFWCQSNLGFQYNIGAVGLEPLSNYRVSVSGSELTPDPNGPIFIEGGYYSLAGLVDQELGVLHTDAKGLGGLNGVLKLQPDLYDLYVTIEDTNGTPVVISDPSDPQDIIVY